MTLLPALRKLNPGLTRIKLLRLASAALAVALVAGGLAGQLRYEGICTLNPLSAISPAKIWATCPLGYLERSLAARQLLPQWPSVLVVLLLIVLLGRVFCAWLCPTVLLRRVFTGKKLPKPRPLAAPQEWNAANYSSYAVLAGVLLASYWFRFPLFCLFCPVGIFFGFLFALGRFFSVDALSLELALFPAMLVLELWVLRKSWCRSFCPLGALMSLFGRLNRFLVPAIRKDRCLSEKGINCQVCKRVCPEGIELDRPAALLAPNSCTKCLECYEKCPANAIKIAIFR